MDKDSSTARKYPFMQVHRDIKGSPTPKIRRQGAAAVSPKNRWAAGPGQAEQRQGNPQADGKAEPKAPGHGGANHLPLPGGYGPQVTIRVTARLMPEVESVTVSIKMEKN